MLSSMFSSGAGVVRDSELSLAWALLAIDHNDKYSLEKIGNFFSKAKGIHGMNNRHKHKLACTPHMIVNYELASQWLLHAASQGDQGSGKT